MSQTSHKQPPKPCAIVIFGANGDLTKRLIVPALYNLAKQGLLPERLALIGLGHSDKGMDVWRQSLHDFLGQILARNNETIDDKYWQPISKALSFLKGEFDDPDAYKRLGDHLAERDKAENLGDHKVILDRL